MQVICPECGTKEYLSPHRWRCACGGAYEPVQPNFFTVNSSDPSLWRFYRMFGVDFKTPHVSMGNVCTPLLPVQIKDRKVNLKLVLLPSTSTDQDTFARLACSACSTSREPRPDPRWLGATTKDRSNATSP